jgi:hypothetical protein
MDESDIEYVRFCALGEANKAYIILDDLLNSLRLLRLENTEKYKTLSTAFAELGIIIRHGIDVFENNTDEHKEWWDD